MSWVLICHGDAIGGHREEVGRYFAETTDLPDGRAEYRWVDDVADARHFDSMIDAMKEWTRVHSFVPLRPDGRANKPLTAWTVEPTEVTP